MQTSLGKRIGVVTTNSTAYVEKVFSLLASGEVVVPLKASDDEYRIHTAQVEQIVIPEGGSQWMTRAFDASPSDALALIAFTSGTEGQPKGVMLTHRNLAEVVERLNNVMQVTDSIREYIGVPVYHSFGLGRCRAVSTAGGSFFIPQQGFNPSEIATMLKRGEINAISAVPSLWRILLSNRNLIGKLGKKVHWIEIGSQYMSRSEKEALKALFPNAIIVQHYGLTEASRTTLLAIHQVEGQALESVGRASGEVAVKITATGQIAIHGPHVATAYLTSEGSMPLQDEEGWLITKDLGYIKNDYLYYQGRADDIINCGGIKVSPEELETKIYAVTQRSSGLAICRKSDLLRGDGFLIAITPEFKVASAQLHPIVLQAIQDVGVNAANAISIIEVDDLPKTATGKIQRRQLSEWYASTAPKTEPPPDSSRTAQTAIQKAFLLLSPRRPFQPQDTFISLGGDSLSYVQVSMELERYLGYLPKQWEHLSLEELERLTPQHKYVTTMETNILFRAIAIMGVVINHAGLFTQDFIAGGAMLLFVIAGLNFARFQGNAVSQGNWLQPLVSLLQNLLVPYLIIAVVYQFYKHDLNLPTLLLYGNFLAPIGHSTLFPAWFIQVLVQCLIIFSLLFSLPAIRNLSAASPWQLGMLLLIYSLLVRVAMPYLWDTDYLYNRVPHMQFWLLAMGWCIYFAQTPSQKILTSLILLGLVPLIEFHDFSSRDAWVLVGATTILWLEYINIFKNLKTAIQIISASAYYIFLTHMMFFHIFKQALKINVPIISVIVAVVGGILLRMSIEGLQQYLFQKKRMGEP